MAAAFVMLVKNRELVVGFMKRMGAALAAMALVAAIVGCGSTQNVSADTALAGPEAESGTAQSAAVSQSDTALSSQDVSSRAPETPAAVPDTDGKTTEDASAASEAPSEAAGVALQSDASAAETRPDDAVSAYADAFPPLSLEEQRIYRTLYPSFSPEVKQIPLDVVNTSDEEIAFGDYLRLQRAEDNIWMDFPALPIPDNAGPLRPTISAPFMAPHSRIRYNVSIEKRWGSDCDYYSLPLEEGVYRFIDEFGNVSNGFVVTQTPSRAQQGMIEWMRKVRVPALAGVTFSPHDFTVPFVCQGIMSDSDVSGVKFYIFSFPEFEEASAVYDSISQDGYVIPTYSVVNGSVVLGEERTYNWEDTPHFYYNGGWLFLYCGDDPDILDSLWDGIVVQNPL